MTLRRPVYRRCLRCWTIYTPTRRVRPDEPLVIDQYGFCPECDCPPNAPIRQVTGPLIVGIVVALAALHLGLLVLMNL